MSDNVQIKGIREGLLVTLGDDSWEIVYQDFLAQLDAQTGFLHGARLALDVGNHVLKAAELGKVRSEISDRDCILWAVLSNSPTTENTAQTLGLATRIGKAQPEYPPARTESSLQKGEQALLVHRTLRSGVGINHAGHVVVIGDVNPGAEIVASGDVIVWGRLRGMVHAGAEGDEHAIVCALDLTPTQLRIAGQIAVTPQRRGKPLPEMARLVDGQVAAETWDPKRPKKE